MTLTDFLLARITEDEAVAREVTYAKDLDALPVGSVVLDLAERDAPVVACKAARGDWVVMGDAPETRWWSQQMIRGASGQPLTVVHRPDRDTLPSLAECEAKRVAVDWYLNDDDTVMGPTVRALAAVYADHPDFREEWRTGR